MPTFTKYKTTDIEKELFNNYFNINNLSNYEYLYFLSVLNDNNIYEEFKVTLSGKNKIVFISDNSKDTKEYFKELKNYFKKFNINEMILIDETVSKYATIKHIEEADIIFFMGGNPVAQREFIKSYDIDNLILGFKGIVIGMSAGAINMGKVSYVSKDEDFPESFNYEGLGLADITVDPHFDLNNKKQKEEFYKQKFEVIGLPDDSFIRVDKYGNTEYFGDCYFNNNN